MQKQMAYIDLQTAPWPVLSDSVCRVDPSRYINRRAVYPGAKNEFITYGFNDPPYSRGVYQTGKSSFQSLVASSIEVRSRERKSTIALLPLLPA